MISELHRVNSSVVWWRYGHFLFDLVSTVIARRGSEVTDVKASDQITETWLFTFESLRLLFLTQHRDFACCFLLWCRCKVKGEAEHDGRSYFPKSGLFLKCRVNFFRSLHQKVQNLRDNVRTTQKSFTRALYLGSWAGSSSCCGWRSRWRRRSCRTRRTTGSGGWTSRRCRRCGNKKKTFSRRFLEYKWAKSSRFAADKDKRVTNETALTCTNVFASDRPQCSGSICVNKRENTRCHSQLLGFSLSQRSEKKNKKTHLA